MTRLIPPFTANRVRMALLRAAGLRIGKGTVMWGTPTIVGNSVERANLSIGVECGFNVGCFIDLSAPVTIGDRVSFGHDVMILTCDPNHRLDVAQSASSVTIGDGAWLAARCTIMPGVNIGAGAIISAASVVATDIAPNTLVSGRQTISLARWR